MEDKDRRIVTVTGVEIFSKMLYGTASEKDVCNYCGKSAAKNQCPFCGYPKDIEFLEGDEANIV
jgi:rubrerythrin